jgi:hypothetical protein
MNTTLLKKYEIQCLLQTCTTHRMASILSILSNEKYTNEEKVEKSIILVKDYWKEGCEIMDELQPLDISEIRNRLYSGLYAHQ